MKRANWLNVLRARDTMKGFKFTINLRNGQTFNTCGFDKSGALKNFKMHFPQYANEKIYPIRYVSGGNEFA